METQKIVNLLNDFEILNSNLKQENGTLLMTKIMGNMAEEIKMKMIQPLNLKQKSLNQFFVTTQIHIFLWQGT